MKKEILCQCERCSKYLQPINEYTNEEIKNSKLVKCEECFLIESLEEAYEIYDNNDFYDKL